MNPKMTKGNKFEQNEPDYLMEIGSNKMNLKHG